MRLKTLLLFLISFLFSVNVYGETYYVSPTGSTAWPNCTTQGSPCLADSTETGKAFLGAAAGDTVYFIAGSYNAGASPNVGDNIPAWVASNSGSSEGTRITFKCLSGTCNVTGTGQGPILGSNGADYITWDGFTITVASNGLFCAYFRNGSDHCTIKNSEIIGRETAQSNNASCVEGGSTGTTYLLVQNNKLHGMNGTGNNNACIQTYNAQNMIFENNEVYGCYTGVYDKAGGSSNTYRYNFFHDNTGDAIGILSDLVSTDPYDIRVYQNVFISTGAQTVDVNMGGNDASYIYIYNNTIYNASAGSIWAVIAQASGHSIDHYEVFNNIIYNASISLYYAAQPTNAVSDYNNLYNYGDLKWGSDSHTIAQWRADGRDVNSVLTDPGFTNPGGTTAADYKRSSYPTNGRGGAYSNVMGAYITGNETIGYSSPGGDTTPPVISNPLPSGTQGCSSHPQSVTLQVTTDESATCKYHTSDAPYDFMPYTFSNTTGTTSHTNPMSLGCGKSYSFYVRCMDTSNNKDTSSTQISFDVRRGHGWHVQ